MFLFVTGQLWDEVGQKLPSTGSFWVVVFPNTNKKPLLVSLHVFVILLVKNEISKKKNSTSAADHKRPSLGFKEHSCSFSVCAKSGCHSD